MSLRFAALGDSITLGMGDPLPTGGWRGFAALLAEAVGATEFRNYATSGAQTVDVAGEQLALAKRWRPDAATVVIGMNDVLRGSFDLGAIAGRLHQVAAELSGHGTRMVTVCLPSPGQMLRLPAALARPLGRRVGAVNDIIHALCSRYPVVHAHAAHDPLVLNRRMWSIDRLHPSERGHRHLARMCYDALDLPGRRPDAEPEFSPPTRAAQALWLATRGTRWLMRRSTDLMPQLIHLAAHEWHQIRRGLDDYLDLAMAQEAAAALAAIDADSFTGGDTRSLGGPGLPHAGDRDRYPAGLR